MAYYINPSVWASAYAVPAVISDKYLKLATEAQLKVILYIFRHPSDSISSDALSGALSVSCDEVENALSFWKERGVLSSSSTAFRSSSADAADAPEKIPSEKTPPEKEPSVSSKKPVVSRPQRPDPAFVAKLLVEDSDLGALLEEVQSALSKPLSPGDTAILVMLYTSYGLPCDVILMLVNYCISVGKGNIRAVERMGLSWSERGISSVSDAEREIERLASFDEAWKRVSSLFGIRSIGNPTKSQLEHADRWCNIWYFSDEMLLEAYERCVNTKGEYSIRYINAILQKWFEKNIKSLDTLKESEKKSLHKKKSSSSAKGSVFSSDASYDLSSYEEQSLFDD